ncbi:MAG: SDR family oxidoreductase [Ilumatobacteraceae bacterium]
MAREVAGQGIRVNGIRPGLIDTPFNEHAPPGRAARLEPTIPLGRMGTPIEIAEAVAWLVGPTAAFTIGAILDVTGGR